MAINFKNPIEQADAIKKNSLSLNFPDPKAPTQKQLDQEVRDMFKNRKEGLEYINNLEANEDEKKNMMARLDRVFPREVKGAPRSYIERVNKEYNDVIPFLKEKGYDVDNFKNADGVAKLWHDWAYSADKDEELQGLYKAGKYDEGNKLYEERYRPLYNALEKAFDKFANDEYVAKAPYGYED